MATPTVYSQVIKSKIIYPDSDGEPMAESDFQREPLIYALEALQTYFHDWPNVYVSGDLLIYYEKGNPEAVVAPDVFVVIGVSNHKRTSYKLWEEKKAPDFVLEITSRSTFFKDQGTKRGLYALLGVQEYFQYDPTNDYLQPPLQGVRLVNNNYQPLIPITLPDSSMALTSDI
jgi:Uma2 family endonuclease